MNARKASQTSPLQESPTVEEMMATFVKLAPLIEGQQVALSAALEINQGQLSKILRGNFVKPKGHALALFEYAKKRLSAADSEANSADTPALQAQLTRKLFAAWDGTREGAAALGVMLDGAARLRQLR